MMMTYDDVSGLDSLDLRHSCLWKLLLRLQSYSLQFLLVHTECIMLPHRHHQFIYRD